MFHVYLCMINKQNTESSDSWLLQVKLADLLKRIVHNILLFFFFFFHNRLYNSFCFSFIGLAIQLYNIMLFKNCMEFPDYWE